MNQILLKQRNLFSWHLDSEIPAGHHDSVAQRQDRVDLVDRFKFFDLRHHGRGEAMLANEFSDLLHIRWVAHETEGDPVDTLLKSEGQILAVFLGQSTHRELHVWEIHPFVVGEHATHGDDAMQGLISEIDPVNAHLDAAIVEKDAAACGDLISKLVVSDGGNRLVAAHLF